MNPGSAQAVEKVGLPSMFGSAKGVNIAEGVGQGTLTEWWNSFEILEGAGVLPQPRHPASCCLQL